MPGVVNNSLAVAGAGVFVAIKSTLDPGGAVNEGAFRPITLKAPEGTIFNVALDAPAGAHGEVRKRAVSVGLGALAQIIPEKVSGDLCGSSFPNAIGGWNPRRNRPFVYYEAPAGGNGGLSDADGASTFVNVDFGNLPSIHNAESIENEMPLMVESCELQNRWRRPRPVPRRRRHGAPRAPARGGGAILRAERPRRHSALGCSWRRRRTALSPVDRARRPDVRVRYARKGDRTPIVRGDVVVMRSSGGGGYGDPLTRDPHRVAEDVARGIVSIEAARDWYGVVIAADGLVDDDATASLRAQLCAARVHVRVVADDGLDPYTGLKGRHRTWSLRPPMRLGWALAMTCWSKCSEETRRRSGPGSASAAPKTAQSAWTPSAARCSASATTTRSTYAVSKRQPYRRGWREVRVEPELGPYARRTTRSTVTPSDNACAPAPPRRGSAAGRPSRRCGP